MRFEAPVAPPDDGIKLPDASFVTEVEEEELSQEDLVDATNLQEEEEEEVEEPEEELQLEEAEELVE